MAEYIERKALIDVIKSNNGKVPKWVEECIINCPTADVVSVVFCKDCAYHKQCSIEDAMSYNKLPSDECFCSVGRRIKIKNGGELRLGKC